MMMSVIRCQAAGLAALTFWSAPAFAQNADLMAKWSAYQVVRYDVVGVYTGENVTIATGQWRIVREPKVADRVEITFDWDQMQYAVVGTPSFKNFTSSNVVPIADEKCGAVRLTGAYEHITLTAIGAAAGPTLAVQAKRDLPAADVPYFGETECGLDHAAAKSVASTFSLLVPPTVYYGMPAAAGQNLQVLPDKTMMVLTDKANGWVWTYKTTPVK